MLSHSYAHTHPPEHADGRGAFLVRGESKLAKGIRIALEVWVMSNHFLSDMIEHMPCHMKTATEFIRLKSGVFAK